jgi:chloride channel 3/4/5
LAPFVNHPLHGRYFNSALIFRILLTIFTFGVQVPAGVFIPSMVWGGLFGRILGVLVQKWQK